MIDYLRIVRYCEIEDGMFGVMTYNSEPFSMCLEPNDRGNGKNSCIPVGVYICKRHSGTKYKDAWCITGVPGRSFILFHIGNIEDDSLGCILLGSSLGSLKKKMSITQSGNTFRKFMKISRKSTELHLTISKCF